MGSRNFFQSWMGRLCWVKVAKESGVRLIADVRTMLIMQAENQQALRQLKLR